jgi:gliding motility-associated-like protein
VPGTGAFGTFTIVVKPISATITTLSLDCNTINFTGSTGNSTYAWSFGDGTTATTNPAIHSYSTAGSYAVILHVTDTTGCNASDTVTVTSVTPLIVDLGPDTSICTGVPYLIQPTRAFPTGTTYLWNTGATTPGIMATTSGRYWLRVTYNGCPSSDSVLLYIVYDSLKLMNEDTVICKGKSVQAVAYINPLATVQWLPTAGIGVSSVANALIIPDTTAMYKITVTIPGCPPLIDSFKITVQPNPQVYLGGNRFVCEFDTLHLHAAVQPAWFTGYTYNWSPATYLSSTTAATVTYTAGSTQNYMVTVTTSAGCKGSDSAVIIVNPGNFASIRNDTVVCPHDSVQLTAIGGTQYHWYPSMYLDDSTAAAPWCQPITTTNYSVIATNASGCHDTLQVLISVWPGALISMEDSVRIYPGEGYHIQPVTNCISFLWTPPVGLDNNYLSNPFAQPGADSRYFVTGTTVNGCTTTDSIDVLVSKESLIEVPNAFTPGTGSNNILYIIKKGQAQINHFRIYNRWGNLVFETTDINTGWDGTYKGEPQPFGVYVYDVQAVTNTGRLFNKHGNITLLR